MSFIFQNAGSILAIISMTFSVAVAVAHFLHRESVAIELQSVQDSIDRMRQSKQLNQS